MINDVLYKFKNLNWTLIFSVFFLSLIGLIMIFSASNSEGMNATYSQLLKITFGFSVMFVVAMIDINN